MRYSDGPALLLSGGQTQMRDCLFEWNDWTTVGGAWPDGVPIKGKAQRATTIRVNDDSGLLLHRLTFRNNGAAQSINAGGSNSIPATVQLCNFQTQLAIQDDGSFVEGGGSPSTIYKRNWCTNSGKSGLRWDGFYPGKFYMNIIHILQEEENKHTLILTFFFFNIYSFLKELLVV